MNFCCAAYLLKRAEKILISTTPRLFSGGVYGREYKRKTTLYYALSFGICMLGVGYAGVPLYRMYCAQTGVGTNSEFARAKSMLIKNMSPVKDREVTVYFSADTHSMMAWNFKPVQTTLTVVPGETALAFYSAENPTDIPITGIATYTVLPTEAAKYFNKIQCFCFEEQRLNPHEKVDMPVFFFLDPEFAEDPRLMLTNHVVLHYTFFEAKKTKMNIPGISSAVSQI
ncbi:Cytochrome c oxidase assembly protein COX11 mitochondrial [Fasciolopsis buskii]|uniref:Cytochrome c oxidase assembly protein COX11, mitochondrial n=1 Tax=Fasciolopsis buskii TaxID=27845 RepID=A0A8E0RKU8_9TREM|nr:Cytochrome c oxidase assembly protein COX11 mitochondrial [Fasciolopsis buski]